MNCVKSVFKFQSLMKSSIPLNNMSTMAAVQSINFQNIIPLIKQSVGNKFNQSSLRSPKIICHRGRSDLYPENTMESITEGLLSCDLVEFDVMLTKDEQVIIFHDRFLGQITNIDTLPEFQNRKTVNNLNQFGQLLRSQWWVKQFSLQQLKKLNVKQKYQTRPQIKDIDFKIPTLEEVIKNLLQKKKHQVKESGILIEIKTQRQNFQVSQRDMILLHKINTIFKKYQVQTNQKCLYNNLPIIVQSFNHQAMKKFHEICPDIPLAHLYYEEDHNISQKYINHHRTPSSIGVAISTKHLEKEFIQMCHKINYEIFYWSVRDDHPQIPLGCASYNEFYQKLKQFKIDGIITDFAANCQNALGLIDF